jgi:hypothetical protein
VSDEQSQALVPESRQQCLSSLDDLERAAQLAALPISHSQGDEPLSFVGGSFLRAVRGHRTFEKGFRFLETTLVASEHALHMVQLRRDQAVATALGLEQEPRRLEQLVGQPEFSLGTERVGLVRKRASVELAHVRGGAGVLEDRLSESGNGVSVPGPAGKVAPSLVEEQRGEGRAGEARRLFADSVDTLIGAERQKLPRPLPGRRLLGLDLDHLAGHRGSAPLEGAVVFGQEGSGGSLALLPAPALEGDTAGGAELEQMSKSHGREVAGVSLASVDRAKQPHAEVPVVPHRLFSFLLS